MIALVVASGCGGGDGEYPSRDWSGRYATRVAESATDCYGATGPPTMLGLIVNLEQYRNNVATVQMTPIIRLAGEFVGDRLEAASLIEEPVGLPDSIAARATAADSLETITYRFEADFARNGFAGRYVIRAPDLRALVLQGEGGRCEYRYRLAGQRIEEAGARGTDVDRAGPSSPEAPAGPR